MPEIEKIIGLVLQTGGNVWQAVKQVQSRLSWIRDIRDRGGEFGFIFRITYEWPQHFYRWSLAICSVGGLLALVGGVLKILNVEQLRFLELFFDNYWLTIVGIGALLFLVTIVNGITWIPVLALSWVPRRWLPRVLESPSWLNARWFCNIFEKPEPLVIRQIGVDAVADLSIQTLVAGNYKSENFAEKPFNLTDCERGNAAIFGCLLEKEHYVRRWGRRSWRPFYAAVGSAKCNEQSIFAPDFVKATWENHKDYYSIIREAVNPHLLSNGQALLPDISVVAEDVMRMVELLVIKYEACAANLAKLTPSAPHPEIRRAYERVLEFPYFNREGMAPQFLKLAVRWDVWPGIEPGNFIYPYSASVAALFLDREAIITLREAKRFSFRSPEELVIVRETMRRVVNTVARRLRSVHRDDYRSVYESLNKNAHPLEWELAQHVDFVLWSEAQSLVRQDDLKNWKVEGGFVVLKNGDD